MPDHQVCVFTILLGPMYAILDIQLSFRFKRFCDPKTRSVLNMFFKVRLKYLNILETTVYREISF